MRGRVSRFPSAAHGKRWLPRFAGTCVGSDSAMRGRRRAKAMSQWDMGGTLG
jgi:hypothetical protein